MSTLVAPWKLFNNFSEGSKDAHERKVEVHESGGRQPKLKSRLEDLHLALFARDLVIDKIEHRDEHGYVHSIVTLHHHVATYDRMRKDHFNSRNIIQSIKTY